MNIVGNKYTDHITDDKILSIVKSVVGKYVQCKVIPQREFDDVEMSVVEKFYNQKEKIFNAFEGKSKITTYCVAVINRMCCEVIRKESKHWHMVVNDEGSLLQMGFNTNAYEAEKEVVLKQEVERLRNLMYFFNDEKAKVILFTKVYFDIPICINDVNEYANSKAKEVMSILNKEDIKLKGDTFTCLARVVNLVENKNVGGDAVRIWFTNQTNTLIKRLNGNGIAQYDKESLSILFEILYKDNSSVSKSGFLVLMILFAGSLC